MRSPPDTRVLIAELAGVGRDYPLSIEKLCPVLSFYVVSDWKEGCERCKQILRYGGMGHTMSIHSRNEEVILQFGLKKPAFRIVVNTPTTLGSIGFTTSLDPSMTLGCGGLGREHHVRQHLAATPAQHQAAGLGDVTCPDAPLPARSGPASGSRTGSASVAQNRSSRGSGRDRRRVAGAPDRPVPRVARIRRHRRLQHQRESLRRSGDRRCQPLARRRRASRATKPTDFVCEEDVRLAVRQGRKIVIGERTIVTPAARDLGEQHRVFVQADWRP